MQHLGEICMTQRLRGKDKQDKRQAKARKEIQKRSFWRRFFSSFLSLLKEKRPPEARADNPSVTAFGRDTSAPLRYAQPSVSTGPPLHKEGCGMHVQ